MESLNKVTRYAKIFKQNTKKYKDLSTFGMKNNKIISDILKYNIYNKLTFNHFERKLPHYENPKNLKEYNDFYCPEIMKIDEFKFIKLIAYRPIIIYNYFKNKWLRCVSKKFCIYQQDKKIEYFTNTIFIPKNIGDNLQICPNNLLEYIYMLAKLSPINYYNNNITYGALLFHHNNNNEFYKKFIENCSELDLEKDFDKAKEEYHHFLNMIYLFKKNTTPNLIEDFMWHSHLQNEYYIEDTESIFDKPLDHKFNYDMTVNKTCTDEIRHEYYKILENDKQRKPAEYKSSSGCCSGCGSD